MMGPLAKLRWFGFLCPCHENDDEYNARIAAAWLQQLEIDWYRPAKRPGSKETFLASIDGFLRLVDRPQGPSLEITSSDPNRKAYGFVSLPEPEVEYRDQLVMDVPLHKIDRLEVLEEDDFQSEIRVYGIGEKPPLLLQFHHNKAGGIFGHTITPEDLAGHIGAIVAWDRVRRKLEAEEERQREAIRRLREEKERLVTEPVDVPGLD